MVDIKADEDLIVERIKEFVDGVQVKPFPDIPPRNYDIKDSRGEILVIFDGATRLNDSPEITKRTQTYVFRWSIVFYFRDRRSHQGIYDIVKKVNDAVMGFSIRYHYFQFVDCRFVTYVPEKQIWVYRSTYEIIDQEIRS